MGTRKIIGQRQPGKLPPCKRSKHPYCVQLTPEFAGVLFHTYSDYDLFHNLCLSAEFFPQRRQGPRPFFPPPPPTPPPMPRSPPSHSPTGLHPHSPLVHTPWHWQVPVVLHCTSRRWENILIYIFLTARRINHFYLCLLAICIVYVIHCLFMLWPIFLLGFVCVCVCVSFSYWFVISL